MPFGWHRVWPRAQVRLTSKSWPGAANHWGKERVSSLRTAAIIPVRNRTSLVVKAIASVQKQTCPLDEIVVVDDGSIDSTPDVVRRLSLEDSSIRLIQLPESAGASAARNVGVNSTQCDWITFLDSDDQWLSQKHKLQKNALANHPQAVASFTGIRYQYKDGHIDVPAPSDITLQALRKRNYLGTTSTAMIQREALMQVGGFDPTLPSCQDWDVWVKLRRIGSFAIVPQPLALFNQTEPVRISRNKEAVFAGHRQLFARILNDVADREERRVVAAHHQVRLTQIYLSDFGQPVAAIATAVRSLALYRTEDGEQLLKAALRGALRNILNRGRCIR
jgi:glycosyltransferase involved in cell wall biosynthesis